jgi:hypothetical protein
VGRKAVLKSLNLLCKKTFVCPHCSALNGKQHLFLLVLR